MRTTIEISDPLFRQAKARVAERGQSLRQLVAEALQKKLASRLAATALQEPSWMRGFGALRRLGKETRRVQAPIDETFEEVEPEDRS